MLIMIDVDNVDDVDDFDDFDDVCVSPTSLQHQKPWIHAPTK